MSMLRILCVHGVGGVERKPNWQTEWNDPIRGELGAEEHQVGFASLAYDDIFKTTELSPWDVAQAITKLTASGIWHGIGDLFRLSRGGAAGMPSTLRWTAGMVMQWADDEDGLRAKTRDRMARAIRDHDPHLICAHSLGSLVAYDTARNHTEGDALFAGRSLLTFGSQIGNPFVRSSLGAILPIQTAANWFHAFNHRDRVFTSRIRLRADNFEQIEAEFDEPASLINHGATGYLTHARVADRVWKPMARAIHDRTRARGIAPLADVASARAAGRRERRPNKKALIIGIDTYKDAPLEGCVNDAFLMSSVLQETGFVAEDIRLLLNSRATAAAVRDRLEWLLEDADDGDTRVLIYSGHGAPGCPPTTPRRPSTAWTSASAPSTSISPRTPPSPTTGSSTGTPTCPRASASP